MSIKDEEDINNKDTKGIDRENLNRDLDNSAEDTEEDVITETVAEEEVRHKIEQAKEIDTIDKNLWST